MLGVWLAGGNTFMTDGLGVAQASMARTEANNNRAPRISGSPAASVLAGEAYSFKPNASDPDNNPLTYSISNKPDWASFSGSTGKLSGTPRDADVGTYPNIRISVSDRRTTTSLAAFRITVNQSADGSVTLSWNPPTTNEDGSQLRDLAGYRIYIGRNSNDFSRVIVLNNPGVTSYVVESLSPATWHFAMTSVNEEGRESRKSPVVEKNVG
jgi:hypothetical protein